MRNRNLQFIGDQPKGYDDLLTFGDLFIDYDSYLEIVRQYVWFEDLDEDINKDILPKYFNQLYNRYKNSYFRFNSVARIAQKTAELLEEFLRYNGMVQKLVKELKPGDTEKETLTFYNTDNTVEDDTSQTIFRTSIEETQRENTEWKALTEQQLSSIIKVKGFNKLIEHYGKVLVMNKRRSVNNNKLLTE